ncbi:electron transfer flavoprotein subunit beta/FixA family protein [Cuniculiplasma sp. SKW3]|uniref:electron transfer flavoprotein subunit beta/FixA family protein n=1 Tax=unclassified Cuniculiplasma TaxID=2619706 RepID=UPI003FD4F5E8
MSLNIIVLVKQIIDIDQLRNDPKTGEPVLQNIPLRIENLSKNAIEAAVQLKEKNGGKVTCIIFGTDKSNSAMKEAYAMGVDEGYIITGYAGNNPYLTAKIISDKIRAIGKYDVVILGNQSADSYTGLLPGLLSAMLEAPLMGNAVSIEADGDTIKIKRVLDESDEIISGKTPCVVSVTQEINQPRLPPVLQIMAAGRKPINVEQAKIEVTSPSKVLSNLAPKSDRKREVYEDVDKGVEAVSKAIRGEIR